MVEEVTCLDSGIDDHLVVAGQHECTVDEFADIDLFALCKIICTQTQVSGPRLVFSVSLQVKKSKETVENYN